MAEEEEPGVCARLKQDGAKDGMPLHLLLLPASRCDRRDLLPDSRHHRALLSPLRSRPPSGVRGVLGESCDIAMAGCGSSPKARQN